MWFRKGFSVLNCLLRVIEKWRESLDEGSAYGALLTDLSKAFNCLPHEMIIAKLYAYGVDMPSLKLINSIYLKEGKELKLMMFIAHGMKYFLGSLRALFLVHYYSMYLYVTFLCSYSKNGIANYADDTTHTQQVPELQHHIWFRTCLRHFVKLVSG